MPTTPHIERHFTAGETVRDVVIGMSDGLTVPFALAAGLSGAISASGLIVTAGLAEIAAGAIAMGLGGYLAARSDAEHYASEELRERSEIVEKRGAEIDEVRSIFEGYGLEPDASQQLAERLSQNPDAWVNFMMRFELGLEAPEPRRALRSAWTIALSYLMGGLIPLMPYILIGDAASALRISVGVTILALFVFGGVKGRFTGTNPLRSGLQTALIGGLAAAAAFGIARAVGG